MKGSAVFVVAIAVLSSVNAIVIPSADSPLWERLPEVPHLRPLPQGLDAAHRGKAFAPARLELQHDLEAVAHGKRPCPGKPMKGYGMGPFRVSGSSLSELLEKYGLGFLPSSANPFASPVPQPNEGSDFRILPAQQQDLSEDRALYDSLRFDKVGSLEEWIEHVKERHVKVIGSSVLADHAYIVGMDPEDFRHAHHAAAEAYARRHEAFFLAFTFGAGIGALARIVCMFIVLLKRSHEHLNSPPLRSRRSTAAQEAEPMLPPYSEVEKGAVQSEKLTMDEPAPTPQKVGIPAAYL